MHHSTDKKRMTLPLVVAWLTVSSVIDVQGRSWVGCMVSTVANAVTCKWRAICYTYAVRVYSQPSYLYTARCLSDQFACSNGNCVPTSYRCDRYNDCADNSDEVGCGKSSY